MVKHHAAVRKPCLAGTSDVVYNAEAAGDDLHSLAQ